MPLLSYWVVKVNWTGQGIVSEAKRYLGTVMMAQSEENLLKSRGESRDPSQDFCSVLPTLDVLSTFSPQYEIFLKAFLSPSQDPMSSSSPTVASPVSPQSSLEGKLLA